MKAALPSGGAAIVMCASLPSAIEYELTGKSLLTPSVIDAVVSKVNKRRITNSKDLRKLRQILPDPVAREHFLSDAGDIASASLRLPYVEKPATNASFTGGNDAVEYSE